jgi:hypothetical protein
MGSVVLIPLETGLRITNTMTLSLTSPRDRTSGRAKRGKGLSEEEGEKRSLSSSAGFVE